MTDTANAGSNKKKSKKTLMVPLVVLLIGLVGGGYFFMTQKKAAEDAIAQGTTTTTALGKIIRLQPITMNLSDGRVLKVGIGLQMVAKPKEEELALILGGAEGGEGKAAEAPTALSPSPLGGAEAKAINEAIMTLGNMTYNELSKPGARAVAKEALTEKITHAYEGDVVAVYFTDFVMS